VFRDRRQAIPASASPKRPADAIARHQTRNADFVRLAAGAYLATEKSFRRIMGFEQLWMLKSYLDRNEETATVAANRKVG
jgi:hypothetical protein